MATKEAPVEASTSENEMHLDDFLNSILSTEHKVESLSAFAKVAKAGGVIKKTYESWLADFRKFETSIP